MIINSLKNMVRGWLIGDFSPSVVKTKDFEVAVKRYQSNDYESRHVHNKATEITVVVSGLVRMNGEDFGPDSIIMLNPGESSDFLAVEDAVTVCVKFPSVTGDKFLC
jgi:hypothetical protein